MKRMHLHVHVKDLDRSVAFYATVFGAPPTVRKPDYAKWMLDDPRVNFAISTHGLSEGLGHVGIQASEPGELAEITQRLKAAGARTFEQENTTCCYAKSDKTWVEDPSGLRWETFYTHGAATTYGADASLAPKAAAAAVAALGAPSCCG